MKYLLPFAPTGVGEYKKKPCISLIYKVFQDLVSFLLVLSSDPESGKRDSHSRCARAVPRNFADTPGPWKGRFEVAGAESIAPACPACKTKGRIFEDSPFCFGAENGTRTRDLNLGKVALYQLSYFRMVPAAGRLPRGLLPVFWDCKYKRFFRFRKIFPQKSTFFSSQQPYLPIKKVRNRTVPDLCGVDPFDWSN